MTQIFIKNYINRFALILLSLVLLGNSANATEISSKIHSEVSSVLNNDFYNRAMRSNFDSQSAQLLSVKISENIIKLFFDENLISENTSIEEITDPIFSTAYYIAEENGIKEPLVEIYINNKSLDTIIQEKEESLQQNKAINNSQLNIENKESTSTLPKKIVINAGHGITETSPDTWEWQRPLMDEVYREDIANAEMSMILVSKLKSTDTEIYSVRELDKSAGLGVSGYDKWKENARQYLKSQNYPESIWNEADLNNKSRDIRCRPLYANWRKADVLISLHTNAASSSARGSQIYISKIDNGYIKQSTELANIIEKHLKNKIHEKYDNLWKVGGPYKKNHGENRIAKMPSVIIELGFHTNKDDLTALLDDKFREIAMEAIKLGVKEYLGIAENPFKVHFDSISPFMADNDTIIFDGMRVDGFGFSATKDAFRIEYNFDYKSLNFTINPSNLKTYSKIGVFNEEHMAVDVQIPKPDYVANGVTYHYDKTYSFEATSNKPFIAELNLHVGDVISWLIDNQSNDFSYQFIGENWNSNFLGKASQGVISSAHRILTDGVYSLKIMPTNSPTLKFNLKIFNANNIKLREISNNDKISVSFKENLRDYAKYKLTLGVGDKLSLPQPSSSDIRMKLVDSLGRMVRYAQGLTLIYQAEKSDDYYLFIDNIKGWGGSYSGTVSIKSVSTSRQLRENVTKTYDKANAAMPK